jgi:hypothetical protein
MSKYGKSVEVGQKTYYSRGCGHAAGPRLTSVGVESPNGPALYSVYSREGRRHQRMDSLPICGGGHVIVELETPKSDFRSSHRDCCTPGYEVPLQGKSFIRFILLLTLYMI